MPQRWDHDNDPPYTGDPELDRKMFVQMALSMHPLTEPVHEFDGQRVYHNQNELDRKNASDPVKAKMSTGRKWLYAIAFLFAFLFIFWAGALIVQGGP